MLGTEAPPSLVCHPGEGRDLTGAPECEVEIPAFAGMTIQTNMIARLTA
jgi:hypothetical protein